MPDLNADFSQRVVVHAGQQEWIPSPVKGVDRRMLDRMGDEVARATSIVRYAPGSRFSAHTHTGGEEFLVLEGVFQDEHGDYPAGFYVRNPPASSHMPGSENGCTIFVKLWQFDLNDRYQMSIDSQSADWQSGEEGEGIEHLPLYADSRETVYLERWAPNSVVNLDADGGLELLVLSGSCTQAGDQLASQSWLRLPVNSQAAATAGLEGCTVWIKKGHLTDPPKAP